MPVLYLHRRGEKPPYLIIHYNSFHVTVQGIRRNVRREMYIQQFMFY